MHRAVCKGVGELLQLALVVQVPHGHGLRAGIGYLNGELAVKGADFLAAGEDSELIELLNPLQGKIAVRYEQDIGLFVLKTAQVDDGISLPIPDDDLQPIEEITMPKAPNRANYDEGVWGSINYSH